jgi:hypothetical protein
MLDAVLFLPVAGVLPSTPMHSPRGYFGWPGPAKPSTHTRRAGRHGADSVPTVHVSAAADQADVVIAEDQLSQDDATPLTGPLPCLRDLMCVLCTP